MPESQKKELFSAGITYMVSGEYAFAFSCFTQAGKSDLPTLYNKALCCYYLSLYNDCRSLLLEAERLLPPLTERLPEKDLHPREKIGLRSDTECRRSHSHI